MAVDPKALGLGLGTNKAVELIAALQTAGVL